MIMHMRLSLVCGALMIYKYSKTIIIDLNYPEFSIFHTLTLIMMFLRFEALAVEKSI